MPITGRSSKQAAKDRAALKRLKKSGIYRGKIDLRKAPTKYQLQKLAALKSAAKSKRGGKSKQPLPPKTKTPGAKVKRTRMTEKQLRDMKPAATKHELTTYALPFLRKGQLEPEWRRFTRTQLTKFLNEYKADDPEGAAEWRSYAVKETWTFDTKAEVKEMRKETNYYFSGVRIDAPSGKIRKVKRNALRKAKSRSRLSAKGGKRAQFGAGKRKAKK